MSGHMAYAMMSVQGQEGFANHVLRASLVAVLGSAQPKDTTTMPFSKKGPDNLTERLDVRVSPQEKNQLRKIASGAGVPVAELVRLRSLGRPVVARTDASTIRELRRLGGLLKKIHLDSGGAYRQQTADTLTALRNAISALSSGR